MSTNDEPSYYEIALTNRQVVSAFVILLGCLLVAFLSGVWIGKGQLASVETAQVLATPPDNATVEAGKPEALDFFEDIQTAGSDKGPEPKIPPKPGTVPAVAEKPEPSPDTIFEGEESATPTPGTPNAPSAPNNMGGRQAAASERPSDKPLVRSEPPRAGSQAVKPATTPPAGAPAVTEKPADRARREAAEKPRPAGADRQPTAGGDREPAPGAIIIQVFASPSRDEAIKVRDRLRKGGEKAYLSPSTKGTPLYRVRVGPFKKRERAVAVAAKIQKSYKLDTWVTQ
ncbi:MAG: SPOR domain-containing protein [Acidobacteriota bacterium]